MLTPELRDLVFWLLLLPIAINIALRVYGLWRGSFKPHSFTWGIWALITGISAAAQHSAGGGQGAVLTLVLAVFLAGVAVAGLRYQQHTIKQQDWLYLAFALAAIPVWLATNNPLYAVMLVAIIDVVGFIPTFRHNWHHPWDDQLWGYALGIINFGGTLLVMDVINLTTTLHPLALSVANAAFILMVLVRRRQAPR